MGTLARLNVGALSPAPAPGTPSGIVTSRQAGAGLVPAWATAELVGQLVGLSRGISPRGAVGLAVALARAGVSAGGSAVEMTRTVAGALIQGRPGVERLARDLTIRQGVRDGALQTSVLAAVPPRPTFVARQSPLLGVGPGVPVVTGESGNDSPSAAAFRDAMLGLLDSDQTHLREPSLLEPADVDGLTAHVASALDPVLTIEDSVARRLHVGGDQPWHPPDPLEPFLVAPELTEPMYVPLAELSQEWLLPGLADVPANTTALVASNPGFIEAFMIGLNHEMGSELLWHEFPTDQRRTFFRQFWDTRGFVRPAGSNNDPENLKDIPPIDAWQPGAALGENTTSNPDQLVLLVRGDIVHRYPNLDVYAVQAVWTDAGIRELGNDELHPLFSGRLEPDVAFFGFGLTPQQAIGSASPEVGEPGWFFVLEERPGEARFGLDIGEPGAAPALSWNDLSWGHLQPVGSDVGALGYIDLDAELPDTRSIVAPGDVAWHADAGLGATGATASQLALITLQRPVRVALHAADMLPE